MGPGLPALWAGLLALQGGCLVNTRLYEQRLDDLLGQADADADTDTDSDTDTDTDSDTDTGQDRDGDGAPAPQDCDDDDPAIHPGACEICGDGIDQNCALGDGLCHPPLEPGYDLAADAQWIDGVSRLDHAGSALASAGDFDGNGRIDVIVGAKDADPYGRSRAGSAWLLLTPFSSTLLLADLRLDGAQPGEQAGASVGSVDIDEDGFDDLLIGAPRYADSARDQGAVYLVRGAPFWGGPVHDLPSVGATWVGEPGSQIGHAVTGVQDADGLPGRDVLVAAEEAGRQRGAVMLVSGGTDAFLSGTRWPLSAISAIVLGEATGDRFGTSIADGGDIDGDGLGDLVIGARTSDRGGEDSGAAYVWRGAPTLVAGISFSAEDADWLLVGENAGDRAGSSVSAGDLDGDGHSDVVIGALAHGHPRGGAVYVVSWAQLAAAAPPTFDLAYAEARLLGEAHGDRLGQAVAAVGDLDCDGVGDLVLGGDGYEDGRGAGFVVFGPVLGDRLLGSDPAVISLYGTPGSDDALGSAVASLGDLDRDGCMDFGLAAPRYGDPPSAGRGRVWVLFGTR